MKEDEGGAAGRGAAGLAPERSARASAPARAPPRARPGTKHTFVTDPPWCHARAGTEDSYRHTQTRPFVSPATIRFLVAASDDTHAPPGPVYPRSGAHSAPTPSAGSTRRHANTWPSHPPLTSTRPRVGTSTSSKRSTDHVCVCASTRAYRPSAHTAAPSSPPPRKRASPPLRDRERTRRPVVVQPTRRRAVGGVTRLASRSGRRRFEPRRRRKRRAPRGEMSIPEVLGVGGGAPRATRGGRRREAPRRKRAKHQVQHVARKVERRGRAGIRTSLVRIPQRRRRFFPGEERGVRGRGDAGVGERRGGGARGTCGGAIGVGERLGPVEGDALVPSRSGETETKTGGRLGAGRSERGGGGVGNNDAGRAKARRRGVEGASSRAPRASTGGTTEPGASTRRRARRVRRRATRSTRSTRSIEAPRWIDRDGSTAGSGCSRPRPRPRGGAGIVVGPKSNRRARRRKPNAVAADDRSIAPVNAARDAAVRARSARMVAATRAAALDRERPREGNRVRTSPPGVAGSSRGCLLGEASRRGPPTTTGRIRVGDRRGRPRRHLRGGVATVRIVTVRVRARVDDGSRHRPEARGGGPRARGESRAGRATRPRSRRGAPRETPRRRFVFHERSDAPRGRRDSARTRPRARGSPMGRSRGGGGGSSGHRRGVGRGVVRPGSVGERRRATRARARGRGDGRGLDRVPGWFPRWGARPAVRRPVRALARARAVLGGLACGFGKGRDGRMRQTNGGKGRGGRAGRARGLGRDAHLEHRNTDGEPHAAHAAPPALILALGRTRTSRRGGSIREWAHRRGRVARRRHHARGKPRGGHETATRVRAASWTRRAREMQTTAGARDVARAARYEPLGRDEADQTKMTMRVTRAGVVLASILRSAGDGSTKK